MGERAARARLQPSLLDRLSDDAPGILHDGLDQRVLSAQALRKAVIRDLESLLNATGLTAGQDMDSYPLAARSVLNFGVPAWSGTTASGVDAGEVARRIRQAIWDFEPRIVCNSLQVRVRGAASAYTPNQIMFDIDGELWGHPMPERLFLSTALDLERGAMELFDGDAGGAR